MAEIKQEQESSKQNLKPACGGNRILFLIAIIFIALLIILFFSLNNRLGRKQKNYSNNPSNQVYPNASNSAGNQGDNLTQINGDSSTGVEVTAVYEKDKSQNQIFFRLYFNTHAVDYSDYDFQKNITIKDPQGKDYKAVNIAKEGAGHHQSIEITFPLVSSTFKLVVKNLAGVPERTFAFK